MRRSCGARSPPLSQARDLSADEALLPETERTAGGYAELDLLPTQELVELINAEDAHVAPVGSRRGAATRRGDRRDR